MEEEIIQKIYKLTNELSSQQQSNQDLASTLTSQLSNLKSKTAAKHASDDQQVHIPDSMTPEQRDTVLQDLKDRLEKALSDQQATQSANQQLEKEVSELRALVKDYETGIETITSKIRIHANATTEGQVRLRREYEALLDAEKGTTAALFMENTMLQTQLRQLSKSLRDVYRSETMGIHEQQIAQLKKENQELLEILKISRLPDQEAATEEGSSAVLQAARPGVVEEFFS